MNTLPPVCSYSIDGHPLPIDELKGTKPTEKIDLSNKTLGVASATIIASCIKGNVSLKELRYGAHLHTIQHSRSAPREHLSTRHPSATCASIPNDTCGSVVLVARSLSENTLCGVSPYSGKGIYTAEGINALCEGLKGSSVTSLT